MMSKVSKFSALHEKRFPVPRAVGINRHAVIMELCTGFPLCQVEEMDEPTQVYDKLMALIVRLARYGMIHGDLNEFNLLVTNEVSILKSLKFFTSDLFQI